MRLLIDRDRRAGCTVACCIGSDDDHLVLTGRQRTREPTYRARTSFSDTADCAKQDTVPVELHPNKSDIIRSSG
jgi:hypothetical protein